MMLSPFPRSAAQVWIAFLTAVLLFRPAFAQDPRGPESQRAKAVIDRAVDPDASRYCANVAPSIAEARIAWQTKRLAELDAQVRQRIADLEKAEASARDWMAKREAIMKAATDGLIAIYARMQPENAARQISELDDQTAAAILSKLKPNAASAILDEMEADRASKLAGFIAAAEEKKS